MGKKIPKVMKEQKRNFIAGAKKKGFSARVAGDVFALIEPFAGYAFNKAHATSYALIAYQTAYLKANYPIEYVTAFMITHTGQIEKVATAVAECRRLGIEVLPPDINRSQTSFTSGEYQSIEDLCRRADLSGTNKRVMESLIKAGALDALGERDTLLHNVGRILSLAVSQQRLRDSGQTTMFDFWGDTAPTPLPSLNLEASDVSMKAWLAWEKEVLGTYLSEHPFSPYADQAAASHTTLCGQVYAAMDGQLVTVAGVVASLRQSLTRNGNPFLIVELEDMDGRLEVMVWPKVYTSTRELWQDGDVLLVEGQIKVKGDAVQLYCDRARHYILGEVSPSVSKLADKPLLMEKAAATDEAVVAPKRRQRLEIRIEQTEDKKGDIARFHRLVDTLRQYAGDDEVQLRVHNGDKISCLRIPQLSVSYSPELHQKLVELAGEEGIGFKANA
jgi:DNA polymerase-3 subunit alpha